MNHENYNNEFSAQHATAQNNYQAVQPVQKVTSIAELRTYAQGQIVQLADFAEGQPFIARLRRPNMLSLISSGKIPNSLLSSATTLFNGNASGKGVDLTETDGESITQLMELMKMIAKASLIDPSYEDIEEAGLELTDDQLTQIFNYSQEGVRALNSFRNE